MKDKWSAIGSAMLLSTRAGDMDPRGQAAPATSPSPYIDMLRIIRDHVQRRPAFLSNSLGIVQDNPSSAQAGGIARASSSSIAAGASNDNNRRPRETCATSRSWPWRWRGTAASTSSPTTSD